MRMGVCRAELVFESFAPNEVLQHIKSAKNIVPFQTMHAPTPTTDPHHPSTKAIPPAKYFGCKAFGCDVFLRCHTDSGTRWAHSSQCIQWWHLFAVLFRTDAPTILTILYPRLFFNRINGVACAFFLVLLDLARQLQPPRTTTFFACNIWGRGVHSQGVAALNVTGNTTINTTGWVTWNKISLDSDQ